MEFICFQVHNSYKASDRSIDFSSGDCASLTRSVYNQIDKDFSDYNELLDAEKGTFVKVLNRNMTKKDIEKKGHLDEYEDVYQECFLHEEGLVHDPYYCVVLLDDGKYLGHVVITIPIITPDLCICFGISVNPVFQFENSGFDVKIHIYEGARRFTLLRGCRTLIFYDMKEDSKEIGSSYLKKIPKLSIAFNDLDSKHDLVATDNLLKRLVDSEMDFNIYERTDGLVEKIEDEESSIETVNGNWNGKLIFKDAVFDIEGEIRDNKVVDKLYVNYGFKYEKYSRSTNPNKRDKSRKDLICYNFCDGLLNGFSYGFIKDGLSVAKLSVVECYKQGEQVIMKKL